MAQVDNTNDGFSVKADGAGEAITLDTGTLKLTTAATDKVGFFGKTPIVQVAAVTNGTTNTGTASVLVGASVLTNTTYKGTVGTSNYTVSDIVTALKNFGLIAQ